MMLIIFGPLLIAVFLDAMWSRAEDVQQVITCQAGSYFKGETASVTCNFHKDMNLDKRSISVARYLTIATTDATARETVLACQRKEEWMCELFKSHFNFSGVINNLLTVEVPVFTADIAGVYICFVIPDKETVSHPCNLSIKADAGMSTPYTMPGILPSNDTHLSQETADAGMSTPYTTQGILPSNDTHLSQETEKDESSHVLKIALPIVVVVIGLPVTGILCFCLYKHRSARNVRRTPPEDGQQNYTPEELSPLTGASEMNGGGSGVGRTAPSKCTPYEQFKREPSKERSSTVTSSAERPTSRTIASETPPPLPSQPTSTTTNSNANDVIDNVISLRALASYVLAAAGIDPASYPGNKMFSTKAETSTLKSTAAITSTTTTTARGTHTNTLTTDETLACHVRSLHALASAALAGIKHDSPQVNNITSASEAATTTTTNTNTANVGRVICHVVSLHTLASAALVAAGINPDS